MGMASPPVIVGRELNDNLREALDLMTRALFILDCAGERCVGFSLASAIEELAGSPAMPDMTPAQQADLDAKTADYNLAVDAVRKSSPTS